jgi:hypothetical protein
LASSSFDDRFFIQFFIFLWPDRFAMKVTVNVECSPEEARAFLGLPDVAPMQEALMAELEQQLRANMKAMSPENLLKTWMPSSLGNVEQAQNVFWSQVQQAMSGLASTTTNAMTAFTDSASRKAKTGA